MGWEALRRSGAEGNGRRRLISAEEEEEDRRRGWERPAGELSFRIDLLLLLLRRREGLRVVRMGEGDVRRAKGERRVSDAGEVGDGVVCCRE
jgi:hypothetical protein